MSFQPKQITHYEAAHLAELQGSVSEQSITYSLGLIPSFVSGDTIHDNAAGSGAVTETIMGSLAPNTEIRIQATDINEQFVAGCKSTAEANNWPVTTVVMAAQDLAFGGETFTHSITSFAFHCIGEHDEAAKEIYRTLKPGGIAVASVWVYMPHVDALQHAHWKTRGRDGPMPVLLPVEDFQEAELEKTLRVGGFEDIKCYQKDCYLTVPDLKRWSQLAWSYLGNLPTGWSQNDEDKWDEAVDDIYEQLQSGDGVSKNEKGETVMRMRACIAVARK